MTSKDAIRQVIKEFHERELPDVRARDLEIPETDKVITIGGPRRSGKTFYCFQKIHELLDSVPRERILYVNFEDDRLFPIGLDDLDDILEAYYESYPQHRDDKLYLFFDEIQVVDHWEKYVRRLDDTTDAKIYVTGSSPSFIRGDIASSLRGRTLHYTLFPLSFKEFLQFNDVTIDSVYSEQRFEVKDKLRDYFRYGGYPEVVLETNNIETELLTNYYDTIIYRDLIEQYDIRNTELLKRLTTYLLSNTSSLFSVNSYYEMVKQEIRVSRDTIRDYLSHLEATNLVFTVPYFSYSVKRQQANPRKIFCIDNGLRNAVSFTFSEDRGKLAENTAYLALRKAYDDIYYWKNDHEVDFVVQDDGLRAFNVTYGEGSPDREIEALHAFADEHDVSCTLLTKDVREEREGIPCVPLWQWLLEQ